MADTNLQLKAIDALVHIHTAIKNAQLHQPVNPTITNSIEMLYLHLVDILRQESPLVFTELEKKPYSAKKFQISKKTKRFIFQPCWISFSV
jgi:hypothetical protein